MGIVSRFYMKIKKIIKLSEIKILKKNIKIGRDLNFRDRLVLNCTEEGRIIIGNGVFFNNDCSVNAKKSIIIGDNCLFGEGVKIYDHNHRFNQENTLIKDQGYSIKPITIGSNCWIGSNTVILAGTSIGDNTVVAAGCVVKGDIPANVVVKQESRLTQESIMCGGQMNKSSTPVISIILPVYNSEKYVGQAIQSVLKQSYEDFELIIVDDGSTDKSGSICDYYSSIDSRITVVHKENGGVCSARNLGISISSGTFITFIDNDDFYEEDFLKILVDTAISTNADLVKSGRKNIKITHDMEILSESICTYNKAITLTKNEFVSQYYEFKSSGILSSIWNGLYKREIIVNESLQFDIEIRHGNEDLIFNSKYTLLCETISIVPDVLYSHFYRLGHSTSTKFYPDQISTRICGVNIELQLVDGCMDQADLIKLEGIRSCFRILIPLKTSKERESFISEIKDGLDMSVLKRFNIIRDKRISQEAKIDLILIKHRLYGIYYFLRRMRLKLE